ncbi:hypothetical protein Nmel_013915, partial [Mimus melanotis]
MGRGGAELITSRALSSAAPRPGARSGQRSLPRVGPRAAPPIGRGGAGSRRGDQWRAGARLLPGGRRR